MSPAGFEPAVQVSDGRRRGSTNTDFKIYYSLMEIKRNYIMQDVSKRGATFWIRVLWNKTKQNLYKRVS
jgi:hypothetical protein